MRRIAVLCAIALAVGLASCQGGTPPTAASGPSRLDALADVAGVPECGFENGAACPVRAAEARCDRGLQLVGTARSTTARSSGEIRIQNAPTAPSP